MTGCQLFLYPFYFLGALARESTLALPFCHFFALGITFALIQEQSIIFNLKFIYHYEHRKD
jgi:hypothetical protein